mmetsp:Transcript_38748/g.89619  ORF Transcript_38748/g.89619 Transcript_38748/m.89619 type:complete len:757 (+) Transcript_38748:43-2313(+)
MKFPFRAGKALAAVAALASWACLETNGYKISAEPDKLCVEDVECEDLAKSWGCTSTWRLKCPGVDHPSGSEAMDTTVASMCPEDCRNDTKSTSAVEKEVQVEMAKASGALPVSKADKAEVEGIGRCLADQIANVKSRQEASDLVAIAQAEWTLKVEPSKDNQTNARVDMDAREAAKELATQSFEKDAGKVLQSVKVKKEAVESFSKEVEGLARMCDDGGEAEALGKMEKDALLNREHDGKASIEAAVVAESLVERTKEKCDSTTLDLDYFVKSAKLHDKEHCGSSLLQASHLEKAMPHLRELEFHAKAAMVLHDDSNRIGHHVVHHLRQHTDHVGEESDRPAIFMNHSLVSLVHAAAKAPLSNLHLKRLHYLDEKHYADLHGDTREAHCAEREDMAMHQPDHWSLHDEGVKAYVNCICVERRPSLVCEAVHAEGLTRAREVAEGIIDEHGAAAHRQFAEHVEQLSREADMAKMAEDGVSELQTFDNQSMQRALPIGPCDDPFSCTVCSEGLCASAPFSGVALDAGDPAETGAAALNVLNFLKSNFHHPKPPCFSMSCSACIGLKPGDFFRVLIHVGASTDCGGWGVFFSSFHLWLNLEMCLSAGPLQRILDAFKKSEICVSLPTITYYPFIGKMGLAHTFKPWWLARAVEFSLEATWPVHGVAPAVGHHCWFHPVSQPKRSNWMSRMLFDSMKRTVGWHWACAALGNLYPGCPWQRMDGVRACKQTFLANRRKIWMRLKTWNPPSFSLRTRWEQTW